MRDNLSGSALTETSLLVLLALLEDRHGYGVKKWIEDQTNGRVSLGMGTLYGAINNLLKKGWIRESFQEARRVYYMIEEAGLVQIQEEYQRLGELRRIIQAELDIHKK